MRQVLAHGLLLMLLSACCIHAADAESASCVSGRVLNSSIAMKAQLNFFQGIFYCQTCTHECTYKAGHRDI